MGTPHNPALEELLPGEPFLILRGSDATAGRYTRAYANDLMIRKSNEPRKPGDRPGVLVEARRKPDAVAELDAHHLPRRTRAPASTRQRTPHL